MESNRKLDLPTLDIRDINTLLSLFEPNRDLLGNFLLFRGQTKDHGRLNPSIFRHGRNRATDIEQEIYTDFYNLIRNYPVARDMRNPWELLCYAQHIGVPTRLLDWTINPLIAAFFAVEDALRDDVSDGILYVLDVTSFYQVDEDQPRLGFRGHTLNQLPQDLPFLQYFSAAMEPKISECEGYSGNPLRIVQPPILDARMQAQSGLFSVSLCGPEPHDSYFGGYMRQYRIDKENKPVIQTQLYRMGIHAASLYPDAEGIGRYLSYRRDRECSNQKDKY